jgi:hypothetical protein
MAYIPKEEPEEIRQRRREAREFREKLGRVQSGYHPKSR